MAARKKKLVFKSSNDYYTHYVTDIAPFLETRIVQDVLAGEELVSEDVKKKYGVGYMLPLKITREAREIWHNERDKAISEVSDIELETVQSVMYYKWVVQRYCGSFGSNKRKRRSVGKNVSEDKYIKYYAQRISDFTGFPEADVEKYLRAEDETMSDVLVANGYVFALADFMQEHEMPRIIEEFIDDMVEATGLDKTEVEIIHVYKEKVRELCGEPG